MARCVIPSPIGPLALWEENGALVQLAFGGEGPAPGTALLREAAAQLAAYFAGERRCFSLPLAPVGTAFQQAVWKEMARIPYGETRSYGELAAALGRPGAARAVGMACHRNPLAIFLPCHRVVGAGGALTGYAGGLQAKAFLLALEKKRKKLL